MPVINQKIKDVEQLMNQKDLISVILPVFEEKKEGLQKSITSILNQTHQNFELIIVLDNPNNLELNKIILEYQNKNSRIKYYSLKEHVGLANALNFAIKKCHGKYIARMDADDIAVENRLEIELKYIQKYNFDLVGSNIIMFNENIKITTKYDFLSKENYKKILYTNPIPHSTWLVKKEVYDKLKGYRNFKKCEDYDFLLRALQSGYTLATVKDVLMYYRLKKESPVSFFYQKRSMIYLSKNYHRITHVKPENLKSYLNNKKISFKRAINYYNAYYASLYIKKNKKAIYLFRMISSIDFLSINVIKKVKTCLHFK